MINLQIQIYTIIYSLIYGSIVSLAIDLNYKYLYTKKIYYRIAITTLFILVWVLIYFIGIKNINNGIVHPVAIMMIIVGFYVENKVAKIIKK